MLIFLASGAKWETKSTFAIEFQNNYFLNAHCRLGLIANKNLKRL